MKAPLFFILFALSLPLFLLSCGGGSIDGSRQAEESRVEDTGSSPATTETPEDYADTAGLETRSPSLPAPEPEVKRDTGQFRGLLFLDETGMFLHDCSRPENRYRLASISEELREQYQTRSPMLRYPGEPLVAVLEGVLEYASEDPDFKGMLQVDQLVNIRARNPRNNCMPYDFYGMGNEPFWNVYISETENLIAYKSLGDELALRFPYQSPKKSGESWSYLTWDDQGRTLEVVVTTEGCSDSMAGTAFDYTMTVRIGGKEFSGCASKGEDR